MDCHIARLTNLFQNREGQAHGNGLSTPSRLSREGSHTQPQATFAFRPRFTCITACHYPCIPLSTRGQLLPSTDEVSPTKTTRMTPIQQPITC
jgi:hypothetical protein